MSKYWELSEEQKESMEEIDINNMSEEKKQRLKEYQKNYCEANKNKKSWFLLKQYVNSFLILWI